MVVTRVSGRVRSLRARLVITVLLVFTVACVAIGVTTTLSLDRYLSSRQDRELVLALDGFVSRQTGQPPGSVADPSGDRTAPDAGSGAPGPGRSPLPAVPGDGFLIGPGQGPGSMAAVFDAGRVERAERAERGGTGTSVADTDVAALQTVPADGAPHDTALSPGNYRAVAHVAGTRTYVVAQPDSAGETVDRLLVTEVIVLGAAVVLAGLGAAVLVRRELRPLERVAGVAAGVGALPLDRGEVHLAARVPDPDPRTEVGQVGTALNHMLDNVEGALAARQESETRLRRFVADASHELRTPLAAIRGYAELSRREPDPGPAGTTHALTRITSQAERMSTLVEDLLLLARLDFGRPLERTEVGLTRLVLDGVGDAHVAGPEHRWYPRLPDDPVTVTGDTHRLAQVVTNLLANARTHTPPGTSVTVGLDRPAPGRVRLRVGDDGPGIPPEVLPRVFERFARGAEGRSRAGNDTPSTGLGLAIVSAVVAAHDGTVSVDNEPGRTVFTVELPGA
ncbi:Osmosensitive K+ channel histidine kinase KdpD [Pseudonocardia sp. Ae168_Ps1]|uniref:sensor histidine kinase n=1 Tax=unclassified Pseudonocardia TaxID=2619320 RepID=UPI00094AB23F|nr:MULTISPECIES: HAMP domain-containing sensor histidine kinase [unclassified Pseudonocardia]OLL76302.1 Osmosensitive K+ channel histidine kinase KdpD [Pseudonocardia sp. Ae150A_Ps1]OLL82301.1 Osmosensitive K+ channel histidine kinase KdpD [Pseudonocardia sp. Ae168_Ps1]OLL83583.1 Osmosensitive K+ channel histidine kinase KdpD [Pseudonocardia sp. Ae263_Ps1]OLL90377.1 Osmosensitive K+ channel histidine kinase KdpD [Pseudonocardia sp. Ae356_Ps1]